MTEIFFLYPGLCIMKMSLRVAYFIALIGPHLLTSGPLYPKYSAASALTDHGDAARDKI